MEYGSGCEASGDYLAEVGRFGYLYGIMCELKLGLVDRPFWGIIEDLRHGGVQSSSSRRLTPLTGAYDRVGAGPSARAGFSND